MFKKYFLQWILYLLLISPSISAQETSLLGTIENGNYISPDKKFSMQIPLGTASIQDAPDHVNFLMKPQTVQDNIAYYRVEWYAVRDPINTPAAFYQRSANFIPGYLQSQSVPFRPVMSKQLMINGNPAFFFLATGKSERMQGFQKLIVPAIWVGTSINFVSSVIISSYLYFSKGEPNSSQSLMSKVPWSDYEHFNATIKILQ